MKRLLMERKIRPMQRLRVMAGAMLSVMLLTLVFQNPTRAAQLDTQPMGINPAVIIIEFCRIPLHWYGCSTGAIPANPSSHSVVIRADTYLSVHASVTCRALDAANGIEVGRVTATWYLQHPHKVIYGLYGRYFLSCVMDRPNGGGAVGGSIDNGP